MEGLNLQSGQYMPSPDPTQRVQRMEAYLVRVSAELAYLQELLQRRLQDVEDRLAALEALETAEEQASTEASEA